MSTSPSFKILVVSAVIVASGVALALLHLENSRLRRQLAERSLLPSPSASLRDENARLKELVDSSTRDSATGAATAQAQLQQARIEIASLEQRATALHAERAAQVARDADALDRNRDPRKGLVRLSHFQDSGRATPTDAVQTAIWAAMKGDEAALAQVCVLNAETRRQAEALLARLPEDIRAQWTAEKLATLSMTGSLAELPALQILGETREDAEHMLVMIRGPKPDQNEKIRLILAPSGWKVVLPPSAIKKLQKTMGTMTPGSP